jgi:hypothetical protein
VIALYLLTFTFLDALLQQRLCYMEFFSCRIKFEEPTPSLEPRL